MDHLLVHDVGASEHKAAPMTADDCVVAIAYEPYTTYDPHPFGPRTGRTICKSTG